jgi:hypothetical protein
MKYPPSINPPSLPTLIKFIGHILIYTNDDICLVGAETEEGERTCKGTWFRYAGSKYDRGKAKCKANIPIASWKGVEAGHLRSPVNLMKMLA